VLSNEVSKDHFGNHLNSDLAFEISSFNIFVSCSCFVFSFSQLKFANFLDNLFKIHDTDLALDCSGPKFHACAKSLPFLTNFSANNKYPDNGSKTCCHGRTA